MRTMIKVGLAGVICLGLAALVVGLVLRNDETPNRRRDVSNRSREAQKPSDDASLVTNDPYESRKSGAVFVDPDPLEDGGVGIANNFTGPVRDPKSLEQLQKALEARGDLGLSVLRSELDALHLGPKSTKEQILKGFELKTSIGLLLMYEGKFEEAAALFEKEEVTADEPGLPSRILADATALRGIVALRRGEIDNCIECVGPSSCIFPIAPEAQHLQKAGSREAINQFTRYLKKWPGDLRVRWLLNLAYMTLGDYPDKVPPEYLIPLDTFQSKLDVGKFTNVAPLVGLTARGPNLAGGSIFDDFNGDHLPDLFTTSLDADLGASFSINKGDGTFEDRTKGAGLDEQIYALNVTRADVDNDGDLDLLLLRGAWEKPMRLSLLRNNGDCTFTDMTISAGMAEPISTESAAWGDFDNDGLIDVYVCGEYFSPFGQAPGVPSLPGNRGRLYRNNGDWTFEDVAAKAGVENERCGKGSSWGDYDDDGHLDLYVSNMNGPSRLYRNQGDGTFKDVAPSLDVTGADVSFAVWFWDFDNDGKLDIYVNDNMYALAETVAVAVGVPVPRTSRPRLYHNLGTEGFRDVSIEMNLDRAMTPMGCNFGDIDNDGYLDFYLGTGGMSYSYLVPNLMFKNVDGKRFEDVTLSSGTGHLQKGHGVSFADWDCDGDIDLFVESGGAVPGDRSYNQLYQNPGHGNHWLKVKLVGTKTNRAAIGTKIHAIVAGPDGEERSIYRTVGNNASFGGNTLVESLGLRDATSVKSIEIHWPTSKTTQTFHDVKAGTMIVITENKDEFETIDQPPLNVPMPKIAMPGTAQSRPKVDLQSKPRP